MAKLVGRLEQLLQGARFGARILWHSPGLSASAVATLGGLVLGFGLSVGVAMAAKGFLIGITPTDPLTYAGVFSVLGLTSILAAYVPAWRAGRVNVVDTLRQE